MDETVKTLLIRLRGRIDSNARTAVKHKDPAAKKAAFARSAAYATALLDAESIVGVKWTSDLE
jgi:hypothetical protein